MSHVVDQKLEARQSGPIPEARQVTSNLNKHTARQRRTIQDEQLLFAHTDHVSMPYHCRVQIDETVKILCLEFQKDDLTWTGPSCGHSPPITF